MGEKSSYVPAAVCIREMMRVQREDVKLKCRRGKKEERGKEQVWLSRRKRGTSTSCSAVDWPRDAICPACSLRHHFRQIPRQFCRDRALTSPIRQFGINSQKPIESWNLIFSFDYLIFHPGHGGVHLAAELSDCSIVLTAPRGQPRRPQSSTSDTLLASYRSTGL